jgi:hypothetical protein
MSKTTPNTRGGTVTGETRSTATVERWWCVEEQDGPTVIVRGVASNKLVLVEHDGNRWVCSECGEQPTRVTQLCVHTIKAAEGLPRDVATQIAAAVMTPRKSKLKSQSQAPEPAASGPSKGANPGAREHVDRHRARDEEYRRIVEPVTTRRITDADRDRLAEARRRKRALVGDLEVT